MHAQGAVEGPPLWVSPSGDDDTAAVFAAPCPPGPVSRLLKGCRVAVAGLSAPARKIVLSYVAAHGGFPDPDPDANAHYTPHTAADNGAKCHDSDGDAGSSDGTGHIVARRRQRQPQCKTFLVVPFIAARRKEQQQQQNPFPKSSSRLAVVTDIWLRCSISKMKLLDPASSVFYRPVQLPVLSQLRGLSFKISGLSETEKYALAQIITACGASVMDDFVRHQTTHLVCPEPCGEKFTKALEWGVPALKPDWLMRIASTAEYVDPAVYLLRCKTLVLAHTRIFISPRIKPASDIAKLRHMAFCLGATTALDSAKSCTHVVTDAVAAVSAPGLGASAPPGAHMVLPAWLRACARAQMCVNELDYRAAADPKRRLTLMRRDTVAPPPPTLSSGPTAVPQISDESSEDELLTRAEPPSQGISDEQDNANVNDNHAPEPEPMLKTEPDEAAMAAARAERRRSLESMGFTQLSAGIENALRVAASRTPRRETAAASWSSVPRKRRRAESQSPMQSQSESPSRARRVAPRPRVVYDDLAHGRGK